MSLRGLSKLRFYTARKKPILRPCIQVPFTPLFSPIAALLDANACHISGGSSLLPFASVLPYIVLKPSSVNENCNLRYIAYVDEMNLHAYPEDKFLHAKIPPPVVSGLLSITFSRYIAMMHGIAVDSHYTVTQLKTCVDQHDCLGCPQYTTVFSVEHNSNQKNVLRVQKLRENM